MTDILQMKAFNNTLLAICYLSTVAAVLLAFGKNIEAAGVGAAITGLIGLARVPSSRNVTVDNAPSDPIPVEGGSNGK